MRLSNGQSRDSPGRLPFSAKPHYANVFVANRLMQNALPPH